MIGIVILNYNTWNETIKCCETIEKYVTQEKYCIYVVDNCSPKKMNNLQEKKLKSNSNIKYISSKENRGYSAGNNIGVRQALLDDCEYILICNSDIEFVDNSIEKMCNYFKKNASVGIVGPQIYNVDNEFQPFMMKTKLTAIGKLKNMLLKTKAAPLVKSFKESFYIEKELTAPNLVFGVMGCCFMMSKACAEYLYPWDERTFLYEEEYIIGSILEKSDFDVYVIPSTHVIHAEGKSTGGMSDFAFQCFINSEQLYLREYLKTNIIICNMFRIIRKIQRKNEKHNK